MATVIINSISEKPRVFAFEVMMMLVPVMVCGLARPRGDVVQDYRAAGTNVVSRITCVSLDRP